MQDLLPLLIFTRVADMGSFTRAADSLGFSKGRVSTAVRALEATVGARLLHRTTRSVQLTESGRAFHARARDLLAEADELHSMFAGERAALRGRLRIDLPTEVARTVVIPALPAFMAAYPDLELELSSTDRQVDLVQEGFDCVLRIGPIGDETLVARPLGRLRMVNAASPAYLARHGVPQSVEDLTRQRHRTIHYNRTLGTKPSGWEYPDGITTGYATVALPGALHVNSVQTYEAAGLAGLGLIQAALLGVHHHLNSGALVEVLPDLSPEPLDMAFVVAHRSNLSRRVRTFTTWASTVLEPYFGRWPRTNSKQRRFDSTDVKPCSGAASQKDCWGRAFVDTSLEEHWTEALRVEHSSPSSRPSSLRSGSEPRPAAYLTPEALMDDLVHR